MIEFNKLVINREGTKLSIDVSVKDSSLYNNVYIEKIIIDSQDTFISTGPSESPLYTKSIEGDLKNVKLELTKGDFLKSLDDTLFFVWVKTKGTPSPETPCGEDNILSLGVVFYLYKLYNYSLNYLKEVNSECIIPKHLIDFILRLKALTVSIETGHYEEAIKYWNKFFKSINLNIIDNECGCN